MKKECAFCDNITNEEREIIRNEHVWAFPTNIPIVPGHILVCPVRCVALFEDLTTEERTALFDMAQRVKESLTKTFNAEGFNYAWNENRVGGQSVPHFHLHILPRKEGDTGIYEYDPRRFLYRPDVERKESSHEELIEIAKLVQDNM